MVLCDVDRHTLAFDFDHLQSIVDRETLCIVNDEVRIDRWYGVKEGRPFHERPFLEKLYVAHDCEAIGKITLDRTTRTLPL